MLRSTFSIGLFSLVVFVVTGCNNKPGNKKPTPNNVFSAVEYDKVVAYQYDGEGGIEIIDEKSGQLAGKINKERVLEKEQVIQITNHLCNPASYEGDRAACFDPHLGIVFYRQDKPVASLSICLDCNYLVSSPKIPNAGQGFSGEGVKGIMDFEKEIGFASGY